MSILNQYIFMYGKKNKLSQPAPILDKISVRLPNAVYGNIMKKASFFFETPYLWWVFRKMQIK